MRQFRLLQHIARRQRLAVGEKNSRCFRQLAQNAFANFRDARVTPIHRKAVTRELDGRRQRVGQGQRAVGARKMNQPRRRARYARRRAAQHGRAAQRITVGVEIVFALNARGCGFACINHHLLAVRHAMQQKKSAAAQTRRIRLHHRQRRGDRHRRIKRIAAPFKNFTADFGGQRVRGSNRRSLLRVRGPLHRGQHQQHGAQKP